VIYRSTLFTIIFIALSHFTKAQSDSFIQIPQGRSSIHVVYEIIEGNKPLIVLQSGARSHSAVWTALIPTLKKQGYSYLAYDRPGLGTSDATEAKRDALTIAKELRQLLLKLEFHDKDMILVGHSMGGVYQTAFNHLFPNNIKGLVMLDSPNGNWEERLRGCLSPSQNLDRDQALKEMRSSLSVAIRAEYEGAEASFDLLQKASVKNDVVIVTGGNQNWPADYNSNCLDEAWNKGQKELMKISSNSIQLITETSGHGIPQQDPFVILQAIRNLL